MSEDPSTSDDEPGLLAGLAEPKKLAPVESPCHSVSEEETLGPLSDPTLDSLLTKSD